MRLAYQRLLLRPPSRYPPPPDPRSGFGRASFTLSARPSRSPTVESVDCRVPFRIDAHFDEGESPGLSGVAIRHYVNALYGSLRIKHGAECIFGRPEAEITYKNILHFSFPFLNLQSS